MKDARAYAEVMVDLPVSRTDRVYHYRVPPELRAVLRRGMRVRVPFGRRRLTGYVVGFAPAPAVEETRDVIKIIDPEPVFTPELYALAKWVARRWLCTTVKVLRTIVAPVRRGAARYVETLHPVKNGAAAQVEQLLARAPKQAAAWRTLQENPGLTRRELAGQTGVSSGVIRALIEKGLVTVSRRNLTRRPYPWDSKPDTPPVPSREQAAALSVVESSLDAAARRIILLHGVTGSGKTEVYLGAVQKVLARGRQALVLVPEIALTGQMTERFRARFGTRVAVLHSGLGTGERFDEWQRIIRGEAPVVLGARSAVFAPLPDPGLIIMDEEHESTYKQEEDPKYHARDVAFARATMHKAVVVLGTATPALKSYSRAITGVSSLVRLSHRVDRRPLPAVTVVDLREEYRVGNRRVFSRLLAEKIEDTLAKKEQAILFLNRRGYSAVVLCRECGLAMRCPHCAISLTHHRDGGLRCHYCGYRTTLPPHCPSCRSAHLVTLGTGTQRVEKEVEVLFPGARVLRMDGDTVTRKYAHARILRSFSAGRADILIGTQMVAKGLDIPGVTMVGVINADTSLLLPDFRAAERTFQLVTQVAGRAGRGALGGEVIIQTHCPEHYSIRTAAQQNYEQFFMREMSIRRKLGYPPFSALARVVIRGGDERVVSEAAHTFRRNLIPSGGDGVQVMGPAPAPVPRLKDQYRWHLVLKAPRARTLRVLLRDTRERFDRAGGMRVTVSIDIEPEYIM